MTSDQAFYRPTRLALRTGLLALAALLFATGCQQLGCDQTQQTRPTGEVPKTAEARLEALVRQIPADTEVSALISDTAAVRKTIQQARDKTGGKLPFLDSLEASVRKQTGIELFSKQGWNEAGLAADGAAGLTSLTGRPIIYVYTTNRKAFEKHFTTQAQSELDISGKPSATTVGDVPLKVMGDEKHKRVAWGYAGKLAVITVPPNEGAVDESTPTATNALQSILTLKQQDSLGQTTGFQKFRDAVAADHNFMIYADSDDAIEEGVLSGPAQRIASASGDSTDTLKKRFDGVGLVFDLNKQRIAGRMWIGMNEKTAAEIRSIYSDAPEVDWANLGTENTLLAARLATTWKTFWQNYLDGLADDRRRNLQNQLKRMGASVGIDTEKDLLNNFTGQMALFVYGIAPNFNATQFSRNPVGNLDQIGAIVAAQVEEPKLLRNTLTTITSKVGGFVEVGTVSDKEVGASDAVHVVSFTEPEDSSGIAAMLMENPPPLRLYAYKRQFAVATNAIDRESMAAYLKGEREEPALTEADQLDLGGTFVTDNQTSGLYVNFVRIRNHLENKLPPIPQVQNTLNALQEVMLNFTPRQKGAFVDLTVDVSASAMGSRSSSDSSGTNDGSDKPSQKTESNSEESE